MAELEQMMPSPVPEVRITAGTPEMLEAIRAAIVDCCARKGFTAGDIKDIATFGEEGDKLKSITLKLNYGEGAELFDKDKLLGEELGLFAGNAVHTRAHLQEMNKQNAAHGGVKVERVPALEDEFRDLVRSAEDHIRAKANYQPKPAASFNDAFARYDKIGVGEIHEHEAPRLMIAAKLPELGQRQGALLLEHLYKNRQGMLDAWLDSPSGTKMPPLLALSANAIKNPPGNTDPNYYGTKRLMEDAKAAGVRVYGFETDATLANNYLTIEKNPSPDVKFGNSAEYPRGHYDYRVIAMNESERQVAEAIGHKHKKMIFSNGAAHIISDVKGVPSAPGHFDGAEIIVVDGKAASSARANHLPWWEGAGNPNKDKTCPDFLLITADPAVLKHSLEAARAPQPPAVQDVKKNSTSPNSSGARDKPPAGPADMRASALTAEASVPDAEAFARTMPKLAPQNASVAFPVAGGETLGRLSLPQTPTAAERALAERRRALC